MSKLTPKHFLEAGSHFGHKASRWNPKMKPFIHMEKNGTHIIDINKTVTQFDKAYELIQKITTSGEQVMFVGTKKNAQAIVKKAGIRTGSHFVSQRWLGGTVTNFRTIQNSITRLADIIKLEKTGDIAKYTKKEQVELVKEKEKLMKFVGGIRRMRKLPKAIIVLDPSTDINAVKEARKRRIPVIGIVDTNGDPELADIIIPANVNSRRSITLLMEGLADAVAEVKGEGQLIVGQEPGANLPAAPIKKVRKPRPTFRRDGERPAFRGPRADGERTFTRGPRPEGDRPARGPRPEGDRPARGPRPERKPAPTGDKK